VGKLPADNSNSAAVLRRKSAGSTFQKIFSGFSWNGSDSPSNTATPKNGNTPSRRAVVDRDDSGELSSPRFAPQNRPQQIQQQNHNRTSSSDYEQQDNNNEDDEDGFDTNASVDIEKHTKQRRKMNREREEITSRLGHRDGLDMKERLLDELARLEGSMRKQQALVEAPALPSDEEELEQQRALAALVMFICRRQSLLLEAKEKLLPEVRPRVVFSTSSQVVPNSVPVLASYTDAFRSQFLG
jgi:hypothetical protein